MELSDALRTTGAVREFTDEPVADQTVYDILETARFAPSGGNRQGWRTIVVKDPQVRLALRDLYLNGWDEYLALGKAGLVPWAPITDREAEQVALREAGTLPRGDFAERLHEVPVMIAVLADLRALAAVDRDFDRYTLVGGASIYPFVWSVLLAAREHGLAGVPTTMLTRSEPQAREVLGVPDTHAVAGLLILGHPVRRPKRLRRAEVEDFTTLDRFDGPEFTA
ncbi:nitroreductase family protein [Nocardia sp. NEAU-G5]|uniref:Nitroreductase family protein n=1 Tax=Nocardia albiluteola TaxID=2842303 RepID=A0ABS6ARZ9_9NOCA|nr:nitroreductase family protein [Nocardia albiluteola]MBU3060787.1 nitroreductase family protein [Nocardia albiluteola]